MGFAESLKKIRQERKLSQQELAKKLGLAQSTIGMWESGRRTPKIAELNRMAKILDITVTRLIGAKREQKIEIEKNEIYIDGIKISDLDPTDVEGVIEYINTIKKRKGKPLEEI